MQTRVTFLYFDSCGHCQHVAVVLEDLTGKITEPYIVEYGSPDPNDIEQNKKSIAKNFKKPSYAEGGRQVLLSKEPLGPFIKEYENQFKIGDYIVCGISCCGCSNCASASTFTYNHFFGNYAPRAASFVTRLISGAGCLSTFGLFSCCPTLPLTCDTAPTLRQLIDIHQACYPSSVDKRPSETTPLLADQQRDLAEALESPVRESMDEEKKPEGRRPTHS